MKTADLAALLWFSALNLMTFVLFGYDKWRAGRSSQRVSEFKLIVFSALGGWLGGLIAMTLFRHKTIKWTFQFKFVLALIPFLAEVWAWWRWR